MKKAFNFNRTLPVYLMDFPQISHVQIKMYAGTLFENLLL